MVLLEAFPTNFDAVTSCVSVDEPRSKTSDARGENHTMQLKEDDEITSMTESLSSLHLFLKYSWIPEMQEQAAENPCLEVRRGTDEVEIGMFPQKIIVEQDLLLPLLAFLHQSLRMLNSHLLN